MNGGAVKWIFRTCDGGGTGGAFFALGLGEHSQRLPCKSGALPSFVQCQLKCPDGYHHLGKKRIPKSIKHPVFPIISPDKTSSFPIISPGIFMMILGGFGHSLHPDAPCSTSWTLAFSYGEAISAINGPFDLFITKELHGKPRKKSGLHIVLYIILYIIFLWFLWFLSIFFGVLTLEEAPHAQAPPSHLGISRCWTWRQFFQPYFGVDFDICIYILCICICIYIILYICIYIYYTIYYVYCIYNIYIYI